MSASPTVLVGNLTADPELKIMANGTQKLSFSVAVNHYWTDQAGEKQEKTSFFNIVAWRNLAENAARVLEKGMPVVASGRLEQRSWEKDDGTKGSTVELVADDIALSVRGLDSVQRMKRDADDGSRGGRSAGPKPSASKPRAKQAVLENDGEPF